MVDINLIGDDKLGDEKSGEEERVDEFTQTSSMDTQELAFEERTETFDTTKTAGLTQKRSYSSLISTLIIMSVIILLGWAIYYFMFQSTELENPAEIPQIIPESATVEDNLTDETEPFSMDTGDENVTDEDPNLVERETRPLPPATTEDVPVANPPTSTVRESSNPLANQLAASSSLAIKTVTDILTAIPPTLNTTLLSYAGRRLRFEFVAASTQQANDYTQQLNQYFGRNNFSVLSENQITGNGQGFEKVLVSASVSGSGDADAGGFVDFVNVNQFNDTIKSLASRAGLQIRQLKSLPSRLSDGFMKVPILMRLNGSKAGLLDFFADLEAQSLNIELTKVLIVSSDRTNFSDENLVLVINLNIYEPS
ncbi:MAG: GspMb/PilO family protein [bacterium]